MPSKITPQNMKDQQFVAEQFGAVTNFDTFLQEVIDTQESLLSGKIGTALFNSSTAEIVSQVKQAAINMTAADLTQRRLVRASANINQDTAAIISALNKIKSGFEEAAAAAISRIIGAGASADSGGFSGGVVVSGGCYLDEQRLYLCSPST